MTEVQFNSLIEKLKRIEQKINSLENSLQFHRDCSGDSSYYDYEDD